MISVPKRVWQTVVPCAVIIALIAAASGLISWWGAVFGDLYLISVTVLVRQRARARERPPRARRE
jgi:hypothetical protein